ncbi:hypothetical protein GGI05_003752, partial [Coemansia sp. RSA 2603]
MDSVNSTYENSASSSNIGNPSSNSSSNHVPTISPVNQSETFSVTLNFTLKLPVPPPGAATMVDYPLADRPLPGQ